MSWDRPTNSAFSLPGTDLGPTSSGLRGTVEHLLTVESGTGDGFYGEDTTVPVTANTPAAGWVFDRWTGDTAFLVNAMAASTYFQVPTADAKITATYRLAPSIDTDGDGIDDAWETTNFGSLAPTASSDTDGDGQIDRAEFFAGTAPKNGNSRFHVATMQRAAGDNLIVQWPSVAGRRYKIQMTTDLAAGAWLPVAINISATPPMNSYTVRCTSPRAFVRVVLE